MNIHTMLDKKLEIKKKKEKTKKNSGSLIRKTSAALGTLEFLALYLAGHLSIPAHTESCVYGKN